MGDNIENLPTDPTCKAEKLSEEKFTQTLGEYRVGVDFNVGKSGSVDFFKRQTATIIDALKHAQTMEKQEGNNPEKMRAISEAMTHYETAAMWAVKATTKPELPEHLKQ